jgi:hypothetical protein
MAEEQELGKPVRGNTIESSSEKEMFKSPMQRSNETPYK